MNAIILAIDSGKFNNVLCHFEPETRGSEPPNAQQCKRVAFRAAPSSTRCSHVKCAAGTAIPKSEREEPWLPRRRSWNGD